MHGHLSQFERIRLPGDGAVDWIPIRAGFGISSFGVNAWTTEEAGADVIGPHVETDDIAAGHEELYYVVSGHARFRIGDDEVDAPAGTLVGVADPAVERSATAVEAGTTVISIGGTPGQPYRLAAWEPIVRAHERYRAGDYEGALGELEPAVEQGLGTPTVLYHLACYESLTGRLDDALAHLRAAIAANPRLGEHARTDADFDAIRDDPAFAAALG